MILSSWYTGQGVSRISSYDRLVAHYDYASLTWGVRVDDAGQDVVMRVHALPEL